LFVCTGNTCRSPMAERLARLHYPQHHWESAGVRIWRVGLSPWAVPVLEQLGAGTENFTSRQVETVAPESFDHVVLIGEPAQTLCPPLPDNVQVHRWDVDDPMPADDASDEERLPVYAATAKELLGHIHMLAESL
jgi:protein-tyrosine-phosphatase